MEWSGPRYRPDRYRECERHPLTAAVAEEVATMQRLTDDLILTRTRLGGLLDLIEAAEDTQKAAERLRRSAA